MFLSRRCLQTALRVQIRQHVPSATRSGAVFAGAASVALLGFSPKPVVFAQETQRDTDMASLDEQRLRLVNEVLKGEQKISVRDLEPTMKKCEEQILVAAGNRTAIDQQMRKVFARMLVKKADQNDDGYVTASELVNFFRFLDTVLQSIEAEVNECEQCADAGHVNFWYGNPILVMIMMLVEGTASLISQRENSKEAELLHDKRREVYLGMFFKLFDADGNGMLDKSEFHNYLEVVHGPVIPKHMMGVWSRLDADQDGKISFEEFRAYYYRTCKDPNRDVPVAGPLSSWGFVLSLSLALLTVIGSCNCK